MTTIDPEQIRKIDLNRRPRLEKLIVGALRDCINQHGPVTKETAPSAAKRVIAAIKQFNKEIVK